MNIINEIRTRKKYEIDFLDFVDKMELDLSPYDIDEIYVYTDDGSIVERHCKLVIITKESLSEENTLND